MMASRISLLRSIRTMTNVMFCLGFVCVPVLEEHADRRCGHIIVLAAARGPKEGQQKTRAYYDTADDEQRHDTH